MGSVSVSPVPGAGFDRRLPTDLPFRHTVCLQLEKVFFRLPAPYLERFAALWKPSDDDDDDDDDDKFYIELRFCSVVLTVFARTDK